MENKIEYENAKEYIQEKFKNIEFIEESHQYFVNGVEYTPVSNIIKEYEVYVNWDIKAGEYADKHGLIKENVQKDWRLNNLKSTITGTKIHEFGESYTNLLTGHPELICESNKRQYIEEYNTLVPTHHKEESIIKFYDELNDGVFKYIPIGAEFRLSTQYMKNSRPICGTCDLLFWKEDKLFPEDSGYIVMDWKTNSKLYNDYNRKFGVNMQPPFQNMVDENLSHYTLQFNMYQRMLESIGIDVKDRVLIWLKDDGYETIQIPKIDDSVLDKVFNKV